MSDNLNRTNANNNKEIMELLRQVLFMAENTIQFLRQTINDLEKEQTDQQGENSN